MSTTPPAGPPLEAAVTELLQATSQLLRRVRTESNPDGLSWSQAAVLSRLAREGARTVAELARAESVKPQSMGATVAALESEGLVARAPHPTDGRQSLVTLTEFGTASRERRKLLIQEWLSASMAQLAPHEQQAIVTAAALIKRLADS